VSRDRVYSEDRQIVDFVFDDAVAAVFGDMIRRSVPGYETVVPLSGLLAARHAAPGGRCYDLGCSLGATALAIVRALKVTDCQVVAVDNSESMLAQARANLPNEPIHWLLDDIQTTPIDSACAVVMNYTLQFVPPEHRLNLLSRIRAGLRQDGVLIVSEKIRFEDPEQQAYFDEAHLEFKRANGYSELEISQKRTALEDVMKPDTLEAHEARFAEAGFNKVNVWFRALNWASFIARP
jgi:tRNA (cmo5U34)-methyltransferase